MQKVAVFVDWENIRKGIFFHATQKLKLKIDYNDTRNVKKFIYSFVDRHEYIHRIFFYVSTPIGEITYHGKKIDLSSDDVYKTSVAFLEKIEIEELIAVRKGKLKFRGMLAGGIPDFIQKQVDMLMGLDIAHLAYNRLVDKIILLCADTDIIPALKVARFNGLQVIVGYCDDLLDISHDIKKHCDFIRAIKFRKIFPKPSKSK